MLGRVATLSDHLVQPVKGRDELKVRLMPLIACPDLMFVLALATLPFHGPALAPPLA